MISLKKTTQVSKIIEHFLWVDVSGRQVPFKWPFLCQVMLDVYSDIPRLDFGNCRDQAI